MPIKKRQKNKSRIKSSTKKDASSGMSESETTEDRRLSHVLRRLSKKHLLNSSSEESSSQKENLPRNLLSDPYDADQETSTIDTSSQSDMECSASHSKGVLSPSRPTNRRIPQNSDEENFIEEKKTTSTSRQTGSYRQSPNSQSLPSSENTPRNEENSVSTNSKNTPLAESYLSPDSLLKAKFPKLNASDTSTPHSMMSDKKSELEDSCFGFESLLSPPPLPFSPVPMVMSEGRGRMSNESTTSGISSMQNSQLSVSTSTSDTRQYPSKKRPIEVNLEGLVDTDNKKRVKRKRPISKKKAAEVDDWAQKLGEEFNDIEMFELSVE